MEALGRAASFPDPVLVLVDPGRGAALVAIEVLLASRPGTFDPRDFARSAANFLARLVGPEQVTDPAVRGLLADLASGRFEALRPGEPRRRHVALRPRPTAERGDGAPTPIRPRNPRRRAPPTFPARAAAPPPPPAAPNADPRARVGDRRGVASASQARGCSPPWGRRPPDAPPPTSVGQRPVADARARRRQVRRRRTQGPTSARSATTASSRSTRRSRTCASIARRSRRAVIDRFRAVEARYGGSDAGARAGAERERFQREVEEDAERRARRSPPTWSACSRATRSAPRTPPSTRFPRALAFTRAVVRLDALRTSVKSRAETIYLSLRSTLDAASDPSRKDAALAALERVKALGDPELTARATQRLADASARAAGTGALARRKELAPELDRVVAEALVVAGAGDVGARAARPRGRGAARSATSTRTA